MKTLPLLFCMLFIFFILAACSSQDIPNTQPKTGSQTSATASQNPDQASLPSSGIVISSSMPEASDTISAPNSPASESNAESSSDNSIPVPNASKPLIAYFSRVGNTNFPDGVEIVASASLMVKGDQITGNTQYIASLIQQNTGGDLFLIQTAEKYPADYDETDEQGRIENRDRPRPALSAQVNNLEDYNVLFLGFPNWYYDMPMAVYSFLEEYDLSGKTIVPFCTSGGGGFSQTIAEIQKLQPGATVLTNGFSTTHSQAENVALADVQAWLDELSLPD